MLDLLSYVGLAPNDGFDEEFYRAFYPDLPGDLNVRRHYRRHGASEGRFRNFAEALSRLQQQHGALPGDFSPVGYRALNPDLAALYPEEWRLTLHYVQYGRSEGRQYWKADAEPARVPALRNSADRAVYGFDAPVAKPPQDFALEVPFGYAVTGLPPEGALAAVLHCDRPERLPSILARLAAIPMAVDLFISTDSETNRQAVEKYGANWRKGAFEAQTAPAGCQGLAALLACFAQTLDRYGLFIHLTTDQPPHHDPADALIGSAGIACSVLSLFNDPRLGVVFPQPDGGSDWGNDYARARSLLRGLGISLNRLLPLQVPPGGAYIARTAVIRPLLKRGLRGVDLAESGDGTEGSLAGALLRSLLILSESSGREWLKVVTRDARSAVALPVKGAQDIAAHRLRIFRPVMSFAKALDWPTPMAPPETRPLLSYPSRNERPRLNLLASAVDAGKGGLALDLFAEIAAELGDDWDLRLIATDAPIEMAGCASLGYAAEPCAPSFDQGERLVVDASDREGWLNLRRGDVFLATNWGTASLARGLEADRSRAFGGSLPLLRLFDEDDAVVYGAGTRAALAADSYRDVGRTLAVIHSEELFDDITRRHAFRAAWCAPYRMDEGLARLLTPGPRERQILVHARPGVARDAFELVCEGLFRWQQSDPSRARHWRLLFIGEDFPERYLDPLQNAEAGGKLTLDAYAERLGRAAVGLSLTLSAHPGPAALDMAAAGLQTVANRYGAKDPRRRFPGVITPDRLNGEGVAVAIETAVALAEPSIGKVVDTVPARLPALPARQLIDVSKLASMLAMEVGALSRRRPPGDGLHLQG